jgi:hypothetical protein
MDSLPILGRPILGRHGQPPREAFLYGFAMPKVQRRPDPPPLETNERPVILVGTALWAVAFVVLVLASTACTS